MYSLFHKVSRRLRSVVIGTTDVNPRTQIPSPENLNVCAFFNEALAASSTTNFSCNATGRYLGVMLNSSDDQILALCEVQVFEGEISCFAYCCAYYRTRTCRKINPVYADIDLCSIRAIA